MEKIDTEFHYEEPKNMKVFSKKFKEKIKKMKEAQVVADYFQHLDAIEIIRNKLKKENPDDHNYALLIYRKDKEDEPGIACFNEEDILLQFAEFCMEDHPENEYFRLDLNDKDKPPEKMNKQKSDL